MTANQGRRTLTDSRHWQRRSAALIAAVAIGALVCLAPPAAFAGPVYTLQDLNSKAEFFQDDQQSGKGGTSTIPGMFNWIVEGEDHMYQQWFWYRIGGQGAEESIDSLTRLGASTSNTNFNAGDDVLMLRYGDGDTAENSTFWIDIRYSLMGGEPGEQSKSLIAEEIKVTNRTASTLDFHLFQYTDFDLSDSPDDDIVMIDPDHPNTVRQWEQAPHLTATETVTTPVPSHFEIAPWSNTLDKLEDGVADDLDDLGGVVGYDDVTWAFQWDFTVAGYGSSPLISKQKRLELLPEPVTVLGVFVGLAALGGYIRRRREAS